MELKIIGALIVICSTTILGYIYGGAYKRRIDELLEMKKAMTILKGEISFRYTQFPEAVKNISQRTNKPISEIFEQISESMAESESESLQQIWSNAFNNKSIQTNLVQDDINAFADFGQTAGHLDKNMQVSSIDLTINYIDMQVEQLKEKSVKSAKMFQSLGVLAGLMITIILL